MLMVVVCDYKQRMKVSASSSGRREEWLTKEWDCGRGMPTIVAGCVQRNDTRIVRQVEVGGT